MGARETPSPTATRRVPKNHGPRANVDADVREPVEEAARRRERAGRRAVAVAGDRDGDVPGEPRELRLPDADDARGRDDQDAARGAARDQRGHGRDRLHGLAEARRVRQNARPRAAAAEVAQDPGHAVALVRREPGP